MTRLYSREPRRFTRPPMKRRGFRLRGLRSRRVRITAMLLRIGVKDKRCAELQSVRSEFSLND